MKAMILAAGLGTRLRPWTLSHPKALVPVAEVPMLDRVIIRLRSLGFDDITVNVHHFADQITDHIAATYPGDDIHVSDESDKLLDTGGAILHAAKWLCASPEPFLVHNVDILSDAPLADIMRCHCSADADISLVTSPRASSRKLIFNESGQLRGWHNLKSDEMRPGGFRFSENMHESAFSGIYVVNPGIIADLASYSDRIRNKAFPVMDFLLANTEALKINEIRLAELNLIDIGKPETLSQADSFFSNLAGHQ